MKWLIDDSLDLGRPGPRRMQPRTTQLDLGLALEEAVEAVRSCPGGAHRTLTLTQPRDTIRLMANSIRMTQVFDNLLTNACKYSDVGGRITVTLERSGSHAVIRVADDGIGIPADMLTKVFERYVQVDARGPRARGGVGLGLALVKELVEQHGGTIVAKSAGLGKGSEFVVRLPALVAGDDVARWDSGLSLTA